MAKKKTESTPDILGTYMRYALEHGERPKSIYVFAQSMKIKEADIYDHFGSFDAIEKAIFKSFFDHTHDLLNKNKEYQEFDPKNKLLSFYYTFFEVLKANRSYVVFALDHNKNKLKVLDSLSMLRVAYQQYVDELDIETMDLKQEKLEEFKNRSVKEFSWGQLLFTLKFWLDDNSAGFEKTDVFIEKSITTGFALLDTNTLSSVFDLGKFLVKEKMMPN